MADVYGVGMPDLEDIEEEGFTPFEAVTILKGFDAEGCLSLVILTSDGIPAWELLGMADVLKRDAETVAYMIAPGEEDEL